MVDYNIAIPQQQLFQAPDVMQNAMRMQQMQTQGASAESANQLRAMQTRGLAQDQQLTALKMQATRQAMTEAAATRARAAGDQNALERAIRESVVSEFGPRPGPDLSVAANRLVAENRFGPAASALGMSKLFTEGKKASADLDKIDIDNLDKEVQVFKTMAPSVRTPEDAAMFVGAMAVHPRISKLILQMGTREELMDKARNDFANDPERWVTANVNLTGQQVVDTLKQTREQTNLGNVMSTQTLDAFRRPIGAPTEQAMGMTPKEAASIETPEQKLAYQAALKRQTAQIDKETAGVETSKQLTTAIKELENAAKPDGLIDQSTGSGFGTAVDATAGFFGVGTSGARAIGQLQPIADLVLKMVPRFEGPQSNADVESYNRAAGQIADPKVPNSIRIDAAKTLIRLMKERKDQFVMQGGGAGSSKVVNFGDLK
jgi:hypothetical protein